METKKCVCLVVPILFRPGEAAWDVICIGVAVLCQACEFFDYRLGDEDEASSIRRRLTQDFAKVSLETLRFAGKCVRAELAFDGRGEGWQHRLRHLLTRPREGLVHYGKAMAVLTDSPKTLLNETYARYVERRPITDADDSACSVPIGYKKMSR